MREHSRLQPALKLVGERTLQITLSATILVGLLLVAGCGKNDDHSSSSTNAVRSERLSVEGKWVTDLGHTVDFRPDGRCTIEPFSGDQAVGTYTWDAATSEVFVSFSTGLGNLDALWPVTPIDGGSYTIDVRDERILGTKGRIKFQRYRDGQPELTMEGQHFRAPEGLPFAFKAQTTFVNGGTGTLLLRLDGIRYTTLLEGESVKVPRELQSGARQAGYVLVDEVHYAWRNPIGEAVSGRVANTVTVEAVEPTWLQLGEPLRTDPSLSWQWFRFDVPSRDSAGKTPDTYALVRTPTGKGRFFDANRSGDAPLDFLRSYQPEGDYLAWIGDKPGTCLWRVESHGRSETVALMPARYAFKHIERAATPGRPFQAGETITLDGSQCPGKAAGTHTTCWAAMSFAAKAGRMYASAFTNTARAAGWSASAWFLTDEKYEQFKAVNSQGGIDFYRSDILGRWYSTLNTGDVPLWTAPSDGTFWVVLHYSERHSRQHFKDECQAWLYEIPAYSRGEFMLAGGN